MKKLAVLGHPIGHTLSPLMHNASIQALGLGDQYEYSKLDVAPDALMKRLAQLPSEGYAGVNLTIPFPFLILPMILVTVWPALP